MFCGHHWEGIAIYQHKLVKYRDDQKALFENSFPRIVSGLNTEESFSEKKCDSWYKQDENTIAIPFPLYLITCFVSIYIEEAVYDNKIMTDGLI